MRVKVPSLEDAVTWKSLTPVLSIIVLVVAGLVGGAVSRADSSALRAETAAQAATGALRVQVDANKAETDAGMRLIKQEVAEGRKDTQAIYQFLLTKQRQPRLERGQE